MWNKNKKREDNGANCELKLVLDSVFEIICIYPGVSASGAYSAGLVRMRTSSNSTIFYLKELWNMKQQEKQVLQ